MVIPGQDALNHGTGLADPRLAGSGDIQHVPEAIAPGI
jgi:hypothetical protein